MAKKVTFTLAPEIVADATDGLLLGDFNNWHHESGIKLKKQKDGSLKATTQLEPGIYQYRYFLNDGRWVNDGNANGYAPIGEYGVENCVINIPFEEVKETIAAIATIEKVKTTKSKKETTKKPEAVKKEVVVAKKEIVVAKKQAEAKPSKPVAEKKPAAKPTKKTVVKVAPAAKKTTKKAK